MSATPKFYDNFVLSNLTLQERLGRSAASLNKDSAVFGQQTRSFVQMLNYGNDIMTARAASHLLNMDVLYSNDAYLLKLTGGVLLNSIVSITPPKINASTPFRFSSSRSYRRWSSLGTVSLKDGSKVNLLAFDIKASQKLEGSDDDTRYEALYCAGNYVQQTIDSGFDGYTPGIFAPIFVGETYKSIWSESVEVTLEMDDNTSVPLNVAWSMDELLAMPDNSYGVLVLNTQKGMALTLGDGEIYGSGYNKAGVDKAGIVSVTVTYVKCDSLAPVDHASIKFNSDITPIYTSGDSVPLLAPLGTGDTADTLRSRAVAEFFAASKITDEQDLATAVGKIPFVKSCSARREYNWPFGKTIRMLYNGLRAPVNSAQHKFYEHYEYNPLKTYGPGDMAVVKDTVYVCLLENYSGKPGSSQGWVKFISLQDGTSIGNVFGRYYPSASIYDNATIVLSGLVLKSRRYWNSQSSYVRGDVVYHSGTKQLWLALRDGGQFVEPGSEEDIPLYGSDNEALRYWASHDEAMLLDDEATQPSDPFYNIGYKFDDYEQMTQAMFESEIKGYFNIAGKLGFTSVVVEPLGQVSVSVNCQYRAPYTMQQQIRKEIEDYICYSVGKELRADLLNSRLTEKFNLSSVYVDLTLNVENGATNAIVLQLPAATYVPPSLLDIYLKETL